MGDTCFRLRNSADIKKGRNIPHLNNMHILRYSGAVRFSFDSPPPGTHTGALIGNTGKVALHATSFRLSATKTSGTGDSANSGGSQTSSPTQTWGSALASKARKANVTGLRRQQQQQQHHLLETVEAIPVTPESPTVGRNGGATASGGPVVVVQPTDPSRSSPRASPSFSALSLKHSAGHRAPTEAESATGPQAQPVVSFVRPMGRNAANGAFPPRRNVLEANPSSSSGNSSTNPRNFTSMDPFTNGRAPQSKQSAAMPAWLLAATNERASSSVSTASGRTSASAPPPPAVPPSSSDPTPTRRIPNPLLAAGAAPAAVANPTVPASASSTSGQGTDLPLSVSFSQVMGRRTRTKSDAQKQGLDSEEANVVDYTWEPDPDLDVIEADAAAEAEARRREKEHQRDFARERRELREAAEAAVQQSYTPGAPAPPAFVGSLKAERIPGRGFGLMTDEDVAAGQLLLVSLPALCEIGPAGELPQMRPLVAEALRLLRLADGVTSPSAAIEVSSAEHENATGAADGAALASLYWGAPRPASARSPVDLVAWRSRQQELLSKASRAGPASAHAAASKACSNSPGSMGIEWTQPRVMSLLQLNLLAEGTQDGAATIARSEPLTSIAGIWPEVALINHSCAPNAVAVLLQDRLVVRATRRIPQGREVLLSWLGSAGALAPFQDRREQLSQMYQFSCRCARCQLESSESVSLPFMYADAERESEEALEVIEEALPVRDLRSLNLALQPLQAAVTQLASAIQMLGEQIDLTAGREGMLMAATMGMPGMAATSDDVEGDGAAAAAASGGIGGAFSAAAAAAAQRMMSESAARKRVAATARTRGGKDRAGGGGKAAGQRGETNRELGPIDRATAEAWLLGGMLPLHEALVDALAYRAAWLGMELGPGWHWPPEQSVVVASSAAAAAAAAITTASAPGALGNGDGGSMGFAVGASAPVVVDDVELEEQQAEAMAEVIGSLASYVDVVGQLLPGSELHTQAAARLLSLSRRYLGPMDRVAGDISRAAYDAFVLRYGNLDVETFERLLGAGIEALDAARKREAAAAERPAEVLEQVGAEGGGEKTNGVDDQEEALEALFLEDQRLREEHAAAAAAAARAAEMAAAAQQTPRSWPLPRGRQAQANVPSSPPMAASVPRAKGGSQAAAWADEEDEEDLGLDLPEDVAVRSARGGGVGGSNTRRRSVMEEAEQDLLKILGSKPQSLRSGASTISSSGVGFKDEEAEVQDEVASVRRLFRRDAVPKVRRGPSGLNDEGNDDDDDDNNNDGVHEQVQPDRDGKSGDAKARAKSQLSKSPQQKFESSLGALMNVFPGLQDR